MSKDTTLQTAGIHYESLRGYLNSHLQKLMRESGQSLNRRESAREKLTRLTKQQFQELSTDVYDEMIRRTRNANMFPFLPVRDDFHPKRNQARQKLATLPSNRFKDLASDIYYEIERRFPSVTKKIKERMDYEPYSPQSQYQERSMSGKFQDKPIDKYGPRDKSRDRERLERDRSRDRDRDRDRARERPRDRDYDRDYERDRDPEYPQRKESQTKDPKPEDGSPAVNLASLDNLMADIGNMLTSPKSQNGVREDKESDSNLSKEKEKENNSIIEKLKADHETEVNEMQREIDSLKSEIQDLKASLEEKSNALEVCEEKVKKFQTDLDEKEKECNELKEEKEKLQKDFDDLTQEHNGLQDDYESREQMANDIRQEATNLLEEIKVLSQKNEELLAEKEKNEEIIQKLKEGKDVKIEEKEVEKEEKEKRSSYTMKRISDETKEAISDGVISQERIDAYEDAISHLLESTKSDVSTDVLIAMKSIVISCKTITEDIEKFENTSSMRSDQREQLDTLKNYLSSALTTLMTAAKSYATSYGKTPVSNLENASEFLTDTVMDLVKFAKRLKSNDSSPTRKESYNQHNAKTISQLKEFIEGNTNKIVTSIQTLLYTLRQSNSFDDNFNDAISGITKIVDDIINESHDTLDSLDSSDYKPNIEQILLDLTNSNSKLDELGQKMISSPQSKPIKQQLASASYDIANYVKTLINELEEK